MNQYVTGSVIRELREKRKMTQAELAEKLFVSCKTVSKWETGKGYPDITLLQPISAVFGVSVTELISGSTVENANISANMLHSNFYVCPVCGNVIHSIGQVAVSCHGIILSPAISEDSNEMHPLSVERVEDEYFVHIEHEMTRDHYISFIAAVSCDGIQFKKLYPEGSPESRFKINGVEKFYFWCNRDGLFTVPTIGCSRK